MNFEEQMIKAEQERKAAEWSSEEIRVDALRIALIIKRTPDQLKGRLFREVSNYLSKKQLGQMFSLASKFGALAKVYGDES